MNIKDIFFRKQIDRLLHNFSEITKLPLAICDPDDNPIFITGSRSAQAVNLTGDIIVNGDLVAVLQAAGDDHQKLAFDYMHKQLEDILNNEFTTQDLVRTTANFWKELNFLYNLMHDIGSNLDVKQICSIVILKIAKALNVERCQILLLDECSDLAAVSAIGEMKVQAVDKWVYENGKSLLLNDIESIPEEVHIKKKNELTADDFPMLSVPIKIRGEKLGVIKVAKKLRHDMFSTDDSKLLSSIAYQIGLAVHNIYMINRVRLSEKIEKEMELASSIQKELLPKTVPNIPELDIAGRCISANAVGGDYYDYFGGKGFYNFVLADVSGHGVSAALFMSTVRSSLRGLFSENIPLSEVAYRMNNFIVSDAGTSGMFVTLFYMRYYFEDHRIEYINSGQTPPILYRKRENNIIRLETGGSPAGFFENMKFKINEDQLEQGDLLVVFTDGLIEAVNKKGIRYGENAFTNMIHDNISQRASDLITKVYEELNTFTDDLPQQDDMTVLVVKRVEN